MKIYFYSKLENKETIATVQQGIIKFFKENGVVVLSNLLEGRQEKEDLSFDNMDGLVIEGGTSAEQAGYLIALALAQKKPILYLLPKGTLIPDQLRALMKNKNLKKLFVFQHYNNKNLLQHLIDFIDIIETGELRREVPTVKFTLRFTPRGERYLTWKSKQKKLSKADLVRRMIDEAIINDDRYQSKLRRPLDNEKEQED